MPPLGPEYSVSGNRVGMQRKCGPFLDEMRLVGKIFDLVETQINDQRSSSPI